MITLFGSPPAGLGQHVVRGRDPAEGVGLQPHDQPGRGRQLLADVLGHAGDRDVQRERAAQRAVQGAGDVVVDDHAGCAGVVGVGGLEREGARPAADQRDVPGREPGEVRGVAARDHRQGAHRCGHVAAAGVGHDVVGDRARRRWRDLLEHRRGQRR